MASYDVNGQVSEICHIHPLIAVSSRALGRKVITAACNDAQRLNVTRSALIVSMATCKCAPNSEFGTSTIALFTGLPRLCRPKQCCNPLHQCTRSLNFTLIQPSLFTAIKVVLCSTNQPVRGVCKAERERCMISSPRSVVVMWK